MDINNLISEYKRAISDNTAAVFVGAGLSVPCGFVKWKDLLKDIADELGLDIDEESSDLISLIQYYQNRKGNRAAINQLLEDKYGNKNVSPNENHKILARLPIKYYWTTNYDNLIESSISQAGKTPDVKKSKENLSIVKRRRDAIVYKMHGDIDSPHNAIITKDDYEIYSIRNELFSVALRGDLVSKTFLFLGFSFEDPNLNYILSRIRILLNDNVKEHYCIFRKINKDDYKVDSDFERAKLKQELRAEDLQRYGIQTALVDNYTDITKILQEIEHRYKQSNVFMSGSADEYVPWGIDKSFKFVRELSKEIVSNNLKIVSGFGKGIGPEVVNGALNYIYSTKYRHIDDYMVLRPFPYLIPNPAERAAISTKYREEIISYAGISVFMFGNKLVNEKIELANGMREEFEISKKNKNVLIPIGATGYISKEFWSEVMSVYDKLYKDYPNLKTEFQELGNEKLEPDKLIKIVINIIQKIKN